MTAESLVGSTMRAERDAAWAEFGRLQDRNAKLEHEVERLRERLEAIAGFGDVNLAGEWPEPLRDIIRSMTDCAKRALRGVEP